MGLFDRVERKLDRAINGAFARAFRAEVQPVEISAAIRRAMDDRAAVVGQGRTMVPNRFVVELDPNDHQRLTQFGTVLEDELVASVAEHVDSQHYQPGGSLHVEFVVRDDLDTGVFRVRPSTGDEGPRRVSSEPAPVRPLHRAAPGSHDTRPAAPRPRHPHPPEATMVADGDVGLAGNAAAAAAGAAAGTAAAGRTGGAWPPHHPDEAPGEGETARPSRQRNRDSARPAMGETRANPVVAAQPTPPDPSTRPYLDVDGDTYPLLGAITVLGRDTTADITLPDAGISRRHAEVRVTHDGPHLVVSLRDLGSTNGTFVNGERIDSRRLSDGDRVTVGRVSFVLRTRGR